MQIHSIEDIHPSRPVIEGAGVKLRRAFGFDTLPLYDPFLLLDDFRSNNPEDYIKGFPWHPHRGIETITYILEGSVEHKDSLGNAGVITKGEIQWMTAGSGIIHQEMPLGDELGQLQGFQLWINLPAKDKLCKPRYQQYSGAEIPCLKTKEGVTIHIISGEFNGITGPVTGIATTPAYFDISIPEHTTFQLPTQKNRFYCAYVWKGSLTLPPNSIEQISEYSMIRWGIGEQLQFETTGSSARFLLFSGKPLREPIAWGGPIVMNTREELNTAFKEYENGTFIKTP